MKKIVLVILIISSSLFSSTPTPSCTYDSHQYTVYYEPEVKSGLSVWRDCSETNYNEYCDSKTVEYDFVLDADDGTNCHVTGLTQLSWYLVTCNDNEYFDSSSNSCVTSCPEGQIPNENGVCSSPECPDGQILDENGTCVSISFPPDFPTTAQKGVPSIRESSISEPDCVPGTVYYTGIAYSQIIGWNSSTQKCVVGAFFCNSGLTWNNVTRTCEIPGDTINFAPDDNGSLSNAHTVSPELASACVSGRWAKSWTYDYCATPAPCYIALDVQDYNLQCGRKYIEYDCTSDYRVKKFLQVSCGNVAKADYNTTDMQVTPTNDVVPDTSNSSAESNNTNSVLSQINSQTNVLKNSLDGLATSVSDISSKQDTTNNKLDSIDGKLNGISSQLNDLNDKAQILSDTKDLADDSSSINDMLSNAMDNGFNTYLNKDYTGGLASGSCRSIPTFSLNFHGTNITIMSQDLLNQWPMDIFRTMVIFMFVFSGVIIAFRSN